MLDQTTTRRAFDFVLPPELEAHEPPEARGISRDHVRLLVTSCDGAHIEHHRFFELPDVLRPGDLLVANDSGTLPSAVTARRSDGSTLTLHFSTHLIEDLWAVEPRHTDISSGESLQLPGGVTAQLLAPYTDSQRLWIAKIGTGDLGTYLHRYGRPIRYPYVTREWPIAAYQTVYAGPVGSAEMPSAGRAFSPDVLEQLAHRGIQFVTLTLHTGVASLEGHERPYPEEFWIPPRTALTVNVARREGRRVIAVGTTVVRALESAVIDDEVVPTHAWTDVVINPARGAQVVDSLLTGLHEPTAGHLMMLEAIAGRRHLERAYAAALEGRYLWHEFGDLHLLLGRS
ncbi:MAG: S-adenosylmethionine:tRNA ribosyltransferase-isomerase [Chloroflexi bacterium]|nr:S-adenosylmethionine:tRNA ribosyltransferase-isomerase [Chloroflexota bacterium]